jgi:hypothetical protein
MSRLTAKAGRAILSPLSQKTEAGIETPHKGPKRPRSSVVFLCPSKTVAVVRRLYSVLAGCIGRPLKRSAGSFAGSLNPIQSATQRLRPKGGGLSLYKGAPAMRNYAQNPAEPSRFPPRQSLFNLVKRTPQGNCLVCVDLTFTQVSGLLAEFPSLIVKFSRLEARHGN